MSIDIIIYWNNSEINGRKTLPAPGHYRPHIRFFEYPDKLWGVGIEIFSKPQFGIPTKARITNSLEVIPDILLCHNKKFEICEGPNVVAIGEITAW